MITRGYARKYVGGNWDTAGIKQFNLLINEGLTPNHKLLDVGCGNLRAGIYFIDYLNIGNYTGLDHHRWLIDAGINNELEEKVNTEKKPTFIVNNNFNLTSVENKFDFIIAKSVFTHLPQKDIVTCLNSVASVLKKDGHFYASISIGSSINNLEESHDNKRFRYTVEEIKELSKDLFNIEKIGNQGCFSQTMLKFTLK